MNFQIEGNVFSKAIFLIFLVFTVYGSQAEQINHPYFWKVEKDGKTSHFLGTKHDPIFMETKGEMTSLSIPISHKHKGFSIDELLCSDEIQYHLENSDLLFVEIDSFTEKSREAVAIQEQWMLSKNGREFQALSARSQGFLKSRGISEQWNLYGYNVVLDNLCKYGFESLDGLRLDEQMTRIAHFKGIPVQELDDFNEKYERVMKERKETADTYKQLSDEQFWMEISLLNEDINHFYNECPPQWHIDMMESYISGKGLEDIEKLLEDLLFVKRWEHLFEWKERNVKWLNRFEEAHKDYDRIFFVGGLGHFVEPISLISMLKDRGYSVEPVSCEQ